MTPVVVKLFLVSNPPPVWTDGNVGHGGGWCWLSCPTLPDDGMCAISCAAPGGTGMHGLGRMPPGLSMISPQDSPLPVCLLQIPNLWAALPASQSPHHSFATARQVREVNCPPCTSSPRPLLQSFKCVCPSDIYGSGASYDTGAGASYDTGATYDTGAGMGGYGK